MKSSLAYCSRGELGLITSSSPMPVHYTAKPFCSCGAGDDFFHALDCAVAAWRNDPTNHGIAWVGIHLSPSKLGQPWCSRNPKIVGVFHIGDVQPKDMDVAVEYVRRLAFAGKK